MTLGEYIAQAVAELDPTIPVRAVRFENAAEASGPSVLWRVAETTILEAVGASPVTGNPVAVIECRSPIASGARFLADDLAEIMRRDGALTAIVDRMDARDDASAQRGGYVASVLVAEIAVPAARH